MIEVRLLGRPAVLVDREEAAPPKGAKAWGLLAYLAASDRSHPRSALAELLFAEAEDPLGALRWNLAALRRALHRPDALKGDSIRLDLPDVTIDARLLDDGDPRSLERQGVGQELLAGMSFSDSPVFELWLAGERRRLRRRAASLLRESALTRLARGDHSVAIDHATQLVSIDPLDEGHHALLIRVHALSGDAAAANRQFEQCRALLRRELAIEPGAAVIAAAHLAATGPGGRAEEVDRRVVDARMTVAWSSFLGGAVDHGIDVSRSVVAMADRGDDVLLQVTARLFLAAMLSIAVRGWDEGAATAAAALDRAEQAGRPFEAAVARGILAGNELMRADYRAAIRHAMAGIARSEAAGSVALNLTFLGAVEADTDERAGAVLHSGEAVAEADRSADPIRIVYASANAGQTLLLAGDPAAARPHIERAIEASTTMLVLLPWPMSLLAEIEIAAGRLDVALDIASRAHALAVTTEIAYQRALALRAIGLVAAARGDDECAMERLTDALGQARRTTGEGYTFHWPVAWILESLAVVSARSDAVASQRWAAALLDHASAIGMDAFIGRARRLLAAGV